MCRQLAGIGTAAGLFAREHLRAPINLVMVVTLPVIFVVASSSVLGSFAKALGGSVAGHAATALGAGWSAAFLAGALGYFQTASSRDADRRLARAGLGALPTAAARIASALAVCLLLTTAAVAALRLRQPIPHLAHTVAAILAFAIVYLAIGTAVGTLVRDELAGSLVVIFVFMLDVFSGPGMAPPSTGWSRVLTPSRFPGELLLRAGAGQSSVAGDWREASIAVAASLLIALGVFWLSARSRA